MSQTHFDSLKGEKYISLETYRKTGRPVRTPVWFADEGGLIYIYSLGNAGKVKRIRNNPHAQIAACDMRGNIHGRWIAVQARIVDAEEAERAHRLLRQKYGFPKAIGDFFSRFRKTPRVVIALHAT
jgi:PPOX class probable F420-dependent enzyme